MYMIIGVTGDDEYEIYDDRYTDERWCALNPKLKFEDNAAGSLTFTIPPANNAYGLKSNGEQKLQRMNSDIYVRKYNRDTGENPIIWGGRIVDESYDFYNNRTVVCEGSLAFFNDTVIPRESMQWVPLCAMISQIVNYWHSGLVLVTQGYSDYNRLFPPISDNRKIFLRIPGHNQTQSVQEWTTPDITVMDLWGALGAKAPVFAWDDPKTCLEALEIFLEYYGGHMWIEYVESREAIPNTTRTRLKVERYFHWDSADQFPTVNQPIVFGENLTDYSEDFDATAFATVIFPLGCSLTDEERDLDGDGDIDWTPKYLWDTYVKLPNTPPIDPTDPTAAPYAPYMYYSEPYTSSSGIYYPSQLTPYVAMLKLDPATGEPVTPKEYLFETQGWRAIYVQWEDITDTLALVMKAVAYLKSAQYNELTININAVDLKALCDPRAVDEEEFKFLSIVHVLSIPHGLNADFVITGLEIDMDEPGNNQLTLTHKDKTHYPMSLTDIVANNDAQTKKTLYDLT